ncbi:MAG: phosphate-starvation-inducible PsiE family protein [Vulcanimicrobiaceae bacterium]
MHDESGESVAKNGSSGLALAGKVLSTGERLVLVIVGILLFIAALVLAWRALGALLVLATAPKATVVTLSAGFLDLVLSILMIAEIIYTVSLSVRGMVLSPRPFLIVGLIAVIRRVLVTTIQEVQPHVRGSAPIGRTTLDLAVLAFVVMAFVAALYILRGSEEA